MHNPRSLLSFSELLNPQSIYADPHQGCEEVMTALDECHAQGFLHKMIGGCNNAKRDVNKCLRAERLERTAKNREKAKEKKEKIQRIWKEIEEEES